MISSHCAPNSVPGNYMALFFSKLRDESYIFAGAGFWKLQKYLDLRNYDREVWFVVRYDLG
jgi:hypothetical protein